MADQNIVIVEANDKKGRAAFVDLGREFAGATFEVGELGKVEAIDPAALADWSAADFVLLLSLGLKPDGDFVGGEMESVIEHNTSRLTQDDQKALAAFFVRQGPVSRSEVDQSSSTR